jgi:hypothetical protein
LTTPPNTKYTRSSPRANAKPQLASLPRSASSRSPAPLNDSMTSMRASCGDTRPTTRACTTRSAWATKSARRAGAARERSAQEQASAEPGKTAAIEAAAAAIRRITAA